MDTRFNKDYQINIYDVDTNLQCKFSSIVNYLWDIVISQSESLGETSNGLVHNCAWVLLKYDIKIYEYPKFKDIINVETEVLGVKKFYGLRAYTIRNSEGKILAEVVSVALLIDIEKRRPMRIAPDQYELYGLKGDIKEDVVLDDLIKVENKDYARDYLTRFSDIDSNKHVNNLKYMEMAMDTLPFEILDKYELARLKVLFKKETTYGDTVHVSSQVIENKDNKLVTAHTIENSEKLLTKLEFEWREK